MNLKYTILWFDDDKDYLDSLDLEPLKEEIRNWGFDPDFQLVTEPDEFTEQSPYKNYDLLVVDYDLSIPEKYGDVFIEEVRNHGIYTEIIFYSTRSIDDLWKKVEERKLEGVFLSTRGAPLLEKIEKVAQQSVRKVLDPNNVRGIVMAEVGEIDVLLDRLVKTTFDLLDDKQKKSFLDKRKKKITDHHNDNISKVKIVSDIETLLEHCDSSKRWQLCMSIFNILDKDKKTMIQGYEDEVLKHRNILAHGIPESIDDALIFHHRGNVYRFDDNESIKLRKNLKEYVDIFRQLNNDFQNQRIESDDTS